MNYDYPLGHPLVRRELARQYAFGRDHATHDPGQILFSDVFADAAMGVPSHQFEELYDQMLAERNERERKAA
jgi:hypothetical protein